MNHLMIAMICIMPIQVAAATELPVWLEGWKVKGDLRLRLEGQDFNNESKKGRNRARFRLRITADKKLTDQLDLTLRFASGKGDPTSTNETFDSSFSGKSWNIDIAQLAYKTNRWKFAGGKLRNPLHHADIIWDSDVNPEGFYQKFSSGGFYLILAEFFVEESASDADINLYVPQFGFKGGKDVAYNLSGSYYSYETSSDSYTFIDALATIKMKGVTLRFDYLKNNTDIVEEEDTAYAAYAQIGNKKPGHWNFDMKYARIEVNSNFAPLADADFGFTDKKGFAAGVGYTSSKHISWKMSIWSVESIVAQDAGYDKVQLNCIAKF